MVLTVLCPMGQMTGVRSGLGPGLPPPGRDWTPWTLYHPCPTPPCTRIRRDLLCHGPWGSPQIFGEPCMLDDKPRGLDLAHGLGGWASLVPDYLKFLQYEVTRGKSLTSDFMLSSVKRLAQFPCSWKVTLPYVVEVMVKVLLVCAFKVGKRITFNM